MKASLFLVASLLLCAPSQAQPDTTSDDTTVTRIEYTRLDQIRKSHSAFLFGSSGHIVFKLVRLRNMTTDENLYGVEIEIDRSEDKVAATTLAFGNLGSLWGSSAGVTMQNIRRRGYIFLGREDLKHVISFLNEVIGSTGREQDKFLLYKIALPGGFEMGMMYDIDGEESAMPTSRGARRRAVRKVSTKWKFIFTADSVSYTMGHQDGIEMLQRLNNFSQYIAEQGG